MSTRKASKKPAGMMESLVSDIPWWAKVGIFVAMTFGVPTVLLGVNVAQNIGVLNNPVAEALEEIKGFMIQQSLVHKQECPPEKE